jgi:hypothetical protein
MPILELSPGELSLLKACVALVLGDLAATGVSNIIKKKNRKLEELYSKLEFSR